ncbi:hypothetical protein HMPREF1624_03930 [Sporothrix schenckii ATCC 58251]|uniref:Uncharacterized protein n=1 Tax=Sporothrix schenckii (strain ATCC 58251 / de Perez 2211183) TaxID=1391915 RepID=U7Q1I4_SPOS1|nr:hypothetical protein HMPREF1624_03930 [Sporothrix schenckii ATCC 58251]
MPLIPAAQAPATELSDDEGLELAAGTGSSSSNLDNSRVSAMYLRHHGDEIHQALDVRVNPSTYSEQRGQVEVLKLPNVEAALAWYRKQYTDVPFDVFNCSWDDLFCQIARAQGDHDARNGRKGSVSWFKYLWRKAGSKSDAIEPWLHLIPDEYGLSIVRGAIGIVFHMAEKSHEKEQSILGGFETITETIHNAMNKGVSFQREPEMHACCQALYDCLVEGIADLIWSLKPEPKGKNLIEKLKNRQERQKSISIEGMLKKVQKKSLELDQCAERILARNSNETRTGVGLLQVEASVARSMLVEARDRQDRMLDISQQTNNSVQLVGRDIKYLGEAANKVVRYMVDENRTLRERIQFLGQDHKQVISATESQNATIAFLAETVINLNRNQQYLLEQQSALVRDVRRSLTPVPMDQPNDIIMWPTQLLDDLGVSLNMADTDMMTVNRYGTSFNPRAHEQAQSLLATDEFLRWYQSRHSGMLFVDGNDASATRTLISPMSVMCSSLSIVFEKSGQSGEAFVLRYFCSLHNSQERDDAERDRARGPVGMLRSLLVQLVAALVKEDLARGGGEGEDPIQEYNLGRYNHGQLADFRGRLRDGYLWELYIVFIELLKYVPKDRPVYCIVDGVSSFEDDRYGADLKDVFTDLIRLVSYSQANLKLLFTCPYRSVYLVPTERLILQEDYLRLQPGGRGGLGMITESSVTGRLPR